MKSIFAICVGTFVLATTASPQTTVHVSGGGCAYGDVSEDTEIITYDPDEETQQLLNKLLDYVGLQHGDIHLYAATMEDANAKADIDDEKQRYIFYNQDFILGIDKENRSWAATAIVAHEIGHHIRNHMFDKTIKRKTMELQADRYSGFLLQKLGATREQAQSGVRSLHGKDPAAGYPSEKERLDAVTNGWVSSKQLQTKAEQIDVTDPSKEVIPQESEEVAPEATPRSKSTKRRTREENTQVRYISRCVFFNEPGIAYMVTSDNNIIATFPNGQILIVAQKIPPTLPGYAWMYEKAGGTGRFGVTPDGKIMTQWPNGQLSQLGYVTNPF